MTRPPRTEAQEGIVRDSPLRETVGAMKVLIWVWAAFRPANLEMAETALRALCAVIQLARHISTIKKVN
jgi:hypothetical protein